MIKCLLTELGRAGRENIWSWSVRHGLGRSLSVNKYIFSAFVNYKGGADHLTFGGGGWVILKKNFPQALVGIKKLHAEQM